jgi:hypothetical protein
MKRILIVPVAVLLLFRGAIAQERPGMPQADRVRLAEFFRLGESAGDRLWNGWGEAPFAVLLVTSQHEFLVRHPHPSGDFVSLGYDSLLGSEVFVRERTQPTNVEATLPAIQPSMISTIVIGEAPNTSSKTSTPWVVTLLHEHFHQLQDSQPDYYPAVNALGLSDSDKTGMWMLEYPFPYDSVEVQRRFSDLSKLLLEALQARDDADRATKLASYLAERRKFQETLAPDSYKYFSFQLWQEGIARYTEYQAARLAATSYTPSPAFRSLEDFTPFERTADSVLMRILVELSTQRLGESRRQAFYSFGAAEGLLLDKINPSWKSRYFTDKFDLGACYEARK